MSLISPFSPKTIREIQSGKRDKNGRKVIPVSELIARKSAMAKKVWQAIRGTKGAQSEGKGARRGPKSDRAKAMAAADKWFSQWIRLRDSDENGRAKCVTCSHTDFWLYFDCGHCVERGNMATRYDEKNSSLQCGGCNYNGGKRLLHEAAIDRKYGPGTVAALEQKALLGRGHKVSAATLWHYAKEFKSRVDLIRATTPSKFERP